MISSTFRALTQNEKKQLLKQFPSLYTRFENFVLRILFVFIVLLVPLLIYDHYNPVASDTQKVYCIVVIVLATCITIWMTKKLGGGFSNSKEINNIQTVQVEVVRVQTTRAIRREDFEDFGIAYYVSVNDKSQQKTLFLWGQYLDILEYEKKFPNTDFEFVRQVGREEFIDFKTLGEYFVEEKTLPPFDKEVWKKGVYPVNGQLLDMSIDEIV